MITKVCLGKSAAFQYLVINKEHVTHFFLENEKVEDAFRISKIMKFGSSGTHFPTGSL